MNIPQRIQRRRVKGWRKPPGAIACSRPGPWGNPFIVGVDGTLEECIAFYVCLMAGLYNLKSRASLEEQETARAYVYKHINELRGGDLMDWCPTNGPCHVNWLLIAANFEAMIL